MRYLICLSQYGTIDFECNKPISWLLCLVTEADTRHLLVIAEFIELLNQLAVEVVSCMYGEGEQFVVLELPLLFESEKMLRFINTVIVVYWFVLLLYPIFYLLTRYYAVWRGGATGRALDLRSTGRGFSSCSGQSCVTTLDKLFTPM